MSSRSGRHPSSSGAIVARLGTQAAQIDGTAFTVAYVLDEAEHERRLRAGIGGIPDERTLAALMILPTDDLAPLPASLVSVFNDPATSDLAAIFPDPCGLRWGRRLVSPPLEVFSLVIEAADWTHGADIAHRWAGYGPRTVRLPRRPSGGLTMMLTEAAHYGIGVTAADGEQQLLEPGPYRPRRWTSARWRFAELVYQEYLDERDAV